MNASCRGQALTELTLTILICFSIITGTALVSSQAFRRLREHMALAGASLTASTFATEERRQGGWKDPTATTTREVEETLNSEREPRAQIYREGRECPSHGETFQVEDRRDSSSEASTIGFWSCATEPKETLQDSETAELTLESTASISASYVPPAELAWRQRGELVSRAMNRAPLEEFRTGFAQNGGEQGESGNSSTNFNAHKFMSPDNKDSKQALDAVRARSHTAQALLCMAEVCAKAPHPACAGGAALQILVEKMIGARQVNAQCPILSRSLQLIQKSFESAAQTRISLLLAAEGASTLSRLPGSILDNPVQLE